MASVAELQRKKVANLEAENQQLRDFIRKLLTDAGWYISAIELDHGVDGLQLRDEAIKLMSEDPGRP